MEIGDDNGTDANRERVTVVALRAEDGHGGQCRGEVTVGVPRDRRGGAAIDGGPLYDSTIR
jgi:hypothetical protein